MLYRQIGDLGLAGSIGPGIAIAGGLGDPQLGVGIRFIRANRFGLSGFQEFRFIEIANRSVCVKIENRRLRFTVHRFGFSVQPNYR